MQALLRREDGIDVGRVGGDIGHHHHYVFGCQVGIIAE